MACVSLVIIFEKPSSLVDMAKENQEIFIIHGKIKVWKNKGGELLE